jgi:hypothetical protein
MVGWVKNIMSKKYQSINNVNENQWSNNVMSIIIIMKCNNNNNEIK